MTPRERLLRGIVAANNKFRFCLNAEVSTKQVRASSGHDSQSGYSSNLGHKETTDSECRVGTVGKPFGGE